MMRKAREVNKEVLVFAELFAGSAEADALFCKQLGLNALVREVIHSYNGLSLHGSLHSFSGDGAYAIGSLPNIHQEFDG